MTPTLRIKLCFAVCYALILGTSGWALHGSRTGQHQERFLQQPAVEQDVKQGIKDPESTLERQTERTLKSPEVAEELRRSATSTILGTFMPGYTFRAETGIGLIFMLTVASLWFTFYFHFIYTSDRSATYGH